MKWIIFVLTISVVASLMLLMGCASSGSGTQRNSKIQNKISSNEDLTLESYLRRLNSVKVTGSGDNISVSIRGNMSITDSDEQPIYILNGQKVGNSFTRVSSMISKGTIISVEAIPASRASIYGMEGGSGVIIIKTR